jgi:hypothetical protein
MEYVRRTWKKALRNPANCPSCYVQDTTSTSTTGTSSVLVRLDTPECEKELRKAVGRGRFMIREMVGVIQLKKYRTMKKRYEPEDSYSQ